MIDVNIDTIFRQTNVNFVGHDINEIQKLFRQALDTYIQLLGAAKESDEFITAVIFGQILVESPESSRQILALFDQRTAQVRTRKRHEITARYTVPTDVTQKHDKCIR